MTSILIPTDFSSCAQNAEDAGMQLAQKFGATVHLFHYTSIPDNWEKMTVVEREKHPLDLKKIYQAEYAFEKIKKRFPEIRVETHITGGKWIDRIRQFVDQKNIDLIVMGSHGASGKNEFFIGSNTQKVVRVVNCPVLVLKQPLKKLDFNKVIYASSFNTNEKEGFMKFKGFIKHFLPEIHLVSVNTPALFNSPLILRKEVLKDFVELCKPLSGFAHTIDNFTIDGGVRKVAEQVGADLIAISNHHKKPLKRMLIGSNVEALVNHANLPVLSINYVQTEPILNL